MKDNNLYKKRPYLIAECAYSHEGNIKYLRTSIQRISETRCVSAIKFHILLDITTYMAPDHDIYEKIQDWLFNAEKWEELINFANNLGLDVIVLADDLASLSFLRSIDERLLAIEIHACSLNDIKMLNEVSKFSIPIVLGIGGSTIEEISFAIDYLKKKGKSDILLMYGFQNFPTKYEYINLKKMKRIKEYFNLPIGYADHTLWDNENHELITISGFLFGANIIEKHFVLEKGKKRVDYESAVSAEDFCSLYEKLNIIKKAEGNGEFELNKYEKEYGKIGPMKKAIVAEKEIAKNEEISIENIAYKRTKKISNIMQKDLLSLLGRKANKRIGKDELINFENTNKKC